MSRYLILFILNLPFVLAALLSTLVDYKMGQRSRRASSVQTLVWLTILAGLALMQPIYQFLFSNKLTQTEPLSLFDVMQITGIILVLFMANRSRIKLELLERRVQDLHQELSIRLAEEPSKKIK